MTVKIIFSDNIPTDTSDEHLWLDEIPKFAEPFAQRVCAKLNEHLGDRQGPYYRVVPGHHALHKWEP